MPHQQATLPLLRGTPTLESAIEQEEDMLLERRIEFFVSLYSNRGDIEDIVSYHLGLGRSETCRLGDINEWLHGSFKVCIPIYTHRQSQQPEKRALIRFPLPYKLGESKYPGNVDEKLRCEAATYIWIKEHCPETPTPQIWGFGASKDAYYLDLLACHDSRIRHQPNSLSDEDDGRAQMARLTIMRALLPHFTNRELRQGPFLYRLTDLHPSSIFVDRHWHVKCLVELEWACSLPAETLRPPLWLTGRSIDDLTGENLEAFKQVYEEFLDVFEEEERLLPSIDNTHSYRTDLMRRAWQTGSFWYFHSLDSPKGLFNLFHQHIHPIFVSAHRVSSEFSRIVSDYWAVDTETIISTKLQDKEEYEKVLRQRFEDAVDRTLKKRLSTLTKSFE
ncbi:hypothetical protein AFGD_003432 [Aspergillus flavus]|nr:hypothetical protein AFGD_003432 [Aspergillus flavus]